MVGGDQIRRYSCLYVPSGVVRGCQFPTAVRMKGVPKVVGSGGWFNEDGQLANGSVHNGGSVVRSCDRVAGGRYPTGV